MFPRTEYHRTLWVAYALWAAALIVMLVPLLLMLARAKPVAVIPFIVGCGVIQLASTVVTAVGGRRLARAIRESDYALCTRCHYRLSGLPELGACPECAQPYVMNEVTRYWWSRLPPELPRLDRRSR